VFHISIWGLGALFGETKPTKDPRGDGTGRVIDSSRAITDD